VKKMEFRFTEELFLRLRQGLLAGLVGGMLIGMLEALWLLALNWTSISGSIVVYAGILYGLLGMAGGVGFGLLQFLASLISKRNGNPASLYSLVFSFIFVINGLVIFRFRIFRDLLHEQPIPLWGNGALLLISVLLFLALFLGLRALMSKTALSALGRVSGTAILVFALIFVPLLFHLGFGAMEIIRTPRRVMMGQEEKGETLPHVLLIMVDALRGDRLSCYGYRGNDTPVIDALATEGVLFEQTIAQSSWTRPATASLVSSLYASSHKTYLKPDLLPDQVLTLPEVLRENGYTTVGFADNINISEAFNFQQGYDQFSYLSPDYFFFADESSCQLAYYNVLRLIREKFLVKSKYVQHYYQDADVVNERVTAVLEKTATRGPTFIFAHYMEPHDPYFAHPYNGEGFARVSVPHPDPQLADKLSLLYDGEISFLDERLGTLFDSMRRLGLYENTLIVLTADHGEEFYDHQGWWHGLTLYNEQIRIPLIIKLPGSRLAGTRISGMVSQIDIAPTIVAAIGGEPVPEFQGMDLLPSLVEPSDILGDSGGGSPEGQTAEPGLAGDEQPATVDSRLPDSVYSEEDHEGNVIQSVMTGEWKLIVANQDNPRGLPTVALFNLAEDPGETHNLAEENQAKVEELRRLMEECLARALESGIQRLEGGELEESTRQRLEALGYME